MSEIKNKKLIKIIKFQDNCTFKKLFASLKNAKSEDADFLILSHLFKCDKNEVNKFGVFQFKTIGDNFLESFSTFKVDVKETKIKLGFGFDLFESFTQKEIRDSREYIIAFLNYLKHLGAQAFFFDNANLLPKEFIIDLFKNIKGVSVFGVSKVTNLTSLSDFELYSYGFNAVEPLFIEDLIEQYLKNKNVTLLNKITSLLEYDSHYFNNYYRIFKTYKNKTISTLLESSNNFEISYSLIK